MSKSWKTALGGVVGALAILFTELNTLFDGKAETMPSIEMVMIAIGMLQMGLWARDNNVTSEQAGAKKQ